MRVVIFIRLALIFCIALLFSCCDNVKKDSYTPKYSNVSSFEKKILVFGVHPLHNPKRLFEVYQPLVDYLNQNINGDVMIVLEASRNYDEFDKKLFSGYFDIALPNPYQTVTALGCGYKVFGKMGDDENFKGIILVRKDSEIKKISDLIGKKVAYPAKTALAATMMPQRYLHDNGINIKKDIQNLYVGSQESSIMSVYLGQSAASATWPPPWNAFIKARPEIEKEVKVMWETEHMLNNGLVAKISLNDELLSKIACLFENLHTTTKGQEILKRMNLSRFEKADNHTYEPVKLFLQKFENDVRVIKDDL